MDNTYGIVSNNTRDQQRLIDKPSAQVSNNKGVVNLLDDVNWRMFIYSCEQTCSNFSYSENEFQNDCPNSTCCFSNRIDDLLLYSFRWDRFECFKFACNVGSAWLVLLIFSLLRMLGNSFVIYDKTNKPN